MIRLVSMAGLAAAALFAPPASSAPLPDTYILAGQSNMSGRGALDALSAEDRVPDPAIQLYGNDGRWREALDPLDSAQGQIDTVSADRLAAVGPGMSFARRMRVLRGRPIHLVPCAKGGSAIDRWAPAQGRDTLYGSCVARAREAGGRVTGILWYQGESDGEKGPEEAARWGSSFAGLVQAFRRDLGEPDLPVVLVQIADRPARLRDEGRYPGWEAVRAAQAAIDLHCTKLVKAAGLSRNADQLHLDTQAQHALGMTLAGAMADLVHGGGCARVVRRSFAKIAVSSASIASSAGRPCGTDLPMKLTVSPCGGVRNPDRRDPERSERGLGLAHAAPINRPDQFFKIDRPDEIDQ